MFGQLHQARKKTTRHDYCATEYQSLVNEDGTKSELKNFNTFMIAHLKFGQAPRIVIRPQASIIQTYTI